MWPWRSKCSSLETASETVAALSSAFALLCDLRAWRGWIYFTEVLDDEEQKSHILVLGETLPFLFPFFNFQSSKSHFFEWDERFSFLSWGDPTPLQSLQSKARHSCLPDQPCWAMSSHIHTEQWAYEYHYISSLQMLWELRNVHSRDSTSSLKSRLLFSNPSV